MLHASKTSDESDNYSHSVRVTYRLGIGIRTYAATEGRDSEIALRDSEIAPTVDIFPKYGDFIAAN